jgi:hypothetical protein
MVDSIVKNSERHIDVSQIQIGDIVSLKVGARTLTAPTREVYCYVIHLKINNRGEQYGIGVVHLIKKNIGSNRRHFIIDPSQPSRNNDPKITGDARKDNYNSRKFYKIG